jgi:hypothetical protein
MRLKRRLSKAQDVNLSCINIWLKTCTREGYEENLFGGIVLFLGWFGIYVRGKMFCLYFFFLVRTSKNYPKII